MIHFFPMFSDDASASPLATELRASGVPHRLLAKLVRLQYRSRVWLLFVGWPKMLLFALQSSRRSHASSPRPDVVVLNSDIEVVVFGLLRAFRRTTTPRIVLLGFIYTPRASRVLTLLRRRYFRAVFAFVDLVICHSSVELDDYRRTFDGTGARFVHVPYGLHVAGRESLSHAPIAPPYVMSAGRSERDYGTLFDAVRGRDVRLRVICDRSEALAGLDVPANVTILRDCYGADYLRELAGASVVAVPLAVDNISAGQMVMIQAMAFGKPVVVTRTRTMADYVTDGHEALLVERTDAAAMRDAIESLLASPERMAAMGSAGLAAFEERFSMRSYVRHVLDAIETTPKTGSP